MGKRVNTINPATSNTRGPLVNLLGTGAIPSDVEASLAARGIKFAAYFDSPSGPRCLITSRFPELYDRLGEQLERLHDESLGLPLRYRLPAPTST